jgi:prepilin-type processing-associated H-X9-DG protein
LYNYYDVYGVFPPGWVSARVAGADNNNYFAWSAFLLPHLEQQALYNRFDFDADIDEGANVSPVGAALTAFRCPSDTSAPTYRSARSGVVYGISNYPGSAGIMLCTIVDDGFFSLNSSRRTEDVTDGLGHTLAAGERIGTQLREVVPVWAGVYDTRFIGMNFWVVLGYTQIPINSEWVPEHCFSSTHEGGANFLLCDGSARFINENINCGTLAQPGIYQDLSLISDGRVIEDY